MSVLEKNVVDALATKNDELVLILFDHLGWNNEIIHLSLLQEKINAYISFFENHQYINCISNSESITGFCIRIEFKYCITENCVKFLNAVNETIKALNGRVIYNIDITTNRDAEN